MADFNYTPDLASNTGYQAQIGTKSDVQSLANDVGNLLTAKKGADVRVAKAEAQYLDDAKKEQYNESQLHLMEAQDKLYENYNTTADPEKRNEFVQAYEDEAKGISNWYGFTGDELTKFTKAHATVTNKLRLYNSNVLGKANDTVNTSTANTADFATMDVTDTANMDDTALKNNKEYLIKTQFKGDKAKYFDAKFSDFGLRLKESVAETTSPEEIDTLLANLDIFATDKLGDTVSVNNKDATVDSKMYNGYHKNRQFLLEKRAVAVTKIKGSLTQHIQGRNKDAYMETVERVDALGGYENPDLKQSAIDSWDLKTQKANTSKINALKKTPEFVNGYADPFVVDSTYKAHGGTDAQFMTDYKTKHDFTQNYLNTMSNADLSANPKQAKIVAEDLVKKLVNSGDVSTAVEIAGKTGEGGVLKSFATATLGEEDPKTLQENVQKLSEGYYSNPSVMSNNMEKDDKSAMFFYNYTMRNGGKIGEEHIQRVMKGNAEGIVQKAGKEFNEEFAGKSNYTENIGIYSALVKYGVPPQTAIDYIKEDTEAHIVSVDTGIFSSMDVDLRGAPNGVQTFNTDELEEVLTPLIDKVDAIGIDGEKKLAYDKGTGELRLYVDEIPMQDMAVSLDDLVKLKQKTDLEAEESPWNITKTKIEEMWDGFMTGASNSIREGIAEFDKARREHNKAMAKNDTRIRVSTNKSMRGEKKRQAELTDEEVVQQPEYVEEVMKSALDTRENATALFNKDGINDYIGFLNTGFSEILMEPLVISEKGNVVVDQKEIAVTSPEGRKELQQVIQTKQLVQSNGEIKDIVKELSHEFTTSEGVGDTATNVKTGAKGMTANLKRTLEKKHGKKLTDGEATDLYLTGIVEKIVGVNPKMSKKNIKALADSAYNLGEGFLGWSDVQKVMKDPNATPFDIAKTYLSRPTIADKRTRGLDVSKGLAKRRAEQYNGTNPDKKITEVEITRDGIVNYYVGSKVIFSKKFPNVHKSTKVGKLKI